MEGRDIADSVTSDFETFWRPRSKTSRSEGRVQLLEDKD